MIDTTPLQNFMARVRTAAKMKTRDIKITTDEALEISACLVQILSNQILNQSIPTTQKSNSFDGGKF